MIQQRDEEHFDATDELNCREKVFETYVRIIVEKNKVNMDNEGRGVSLKKISTSLSGLGESEGGCTLSGVEGAEVICKERRRK